VSGLAVVVALAARRAERLGSDIVIERWDVELE